MPARNALPGIDHLQRGGRRRQTWPTPRRRLQGYLKLAPTGSSRIRPRRCSRPSSNHAARRRHASNLDAIRRQVAAAAVRANRSPDHITLLAVSKTFEADAVRPAAAAGQRHFGENRVQEGLERPPRSRTCLEWHLIGHLQSNKARKAAGRFSGSRHRSDRPAREDRPRRHRARDAAEDPAAGRSRGRGDEVRGREPHHDLARAALEAAPPSSAA